MVAIEAFASTGAGVGAAVGVEAAATVAAGLEEAAGGVVVLVSQPPTNKAAANTPADKETFTRFFFILISPFFVFRGFQPAEKIWFS
jgi:hypothetical protein